MAYRQYVGSRYVPIFGRKGEDTYEWDNSAPYEPLTVVMHQGNSFTSVQYVPTGIDINNRRYWAETGNWNAQVEAYRQEVRTFDGRITANKDAIEQLDDDISSELTNIKSDGWVTTNRIADDAITTDKIADNAINTGKIAGNAITTDKVADDAITTGKIAGNAISTGKIADNAITTGKIAGNAITTDKIAGNAINTGKIVDDAITTDKIADDSITADKLDDKIILTEPSFRCVDRFIYGDIGTNGVSSAQAGCVFTQDGVEYWAQILNSDTTDQDVLVIRNIQNQQQVVSKTFELGHGYSLTYNPTTKQLMTENIEVSPMQIIIINVNTITNPYIEETIALGRTPVDNPFWYGNYIAGFQIAGGNHDIVVMDKNQTVIKRMHVDFYDTFHFGQGFVFQSAQYFGDTGEYYIGMTQGDGIAICEEINDNVVMKNYIPCRDYYSFIYMRELEFAYRNGDKLYINTYDEVDELLVPALLVWDMKHGTIQAENSWRIQHSGNIGFTVDYDNGSLIPGVSSTFKLAGDALRAARSCGHVGSVYIIFNSDYPHVFKLEGHEVTIYASSPRNIKGIHGVFSQLRIEKAGNFTFETSILLSKPYYAGIYLRDSTLSISDTVIPHRDNDTTNHFTIIAEYSTCHLENVSASDLYIMCRRSALFLATADQVSGILVRTFVSGVTSKNV